MDISPNSAGMMQMLSRAAESSKNAAAAALASGIIAASGRPHSIEEAMDVYQNVYFTMFPAPGYGHYQAYQANKDQIVRTTHT